MALEQYLSGFDNLGASKKQDFCNETQCSVAFLVKITDVSKLT